MQNLLNKIKQYKIALLTTLILMFNTANAQVRYTLPCYHLLLESSHIVALEQIGTLERSNKNDGDVEKYLKLFGLKTGSPYCAAGQYYCFLEGAKRKNISKDSIPIIKSALCLEIYNDAKKRGYKTKYVPKKYDLIVWKRSNSWQGHIERVHNVLPKGWVETIGFNSSKTINGKKQEGVFLQKRNILHPLGRLKIKGLVGFKYD
jgi:hypothetical protein